MLQKKCIFCIFLFKKHEIWRNKCFSHRRNLADGALRNHFITTARFMSGCSVKLSFPFSLFRFRFCRRDIESLQKELLNTSIDTSEKNNDIYKTHPAKSNDLQGDVVIAEREGKFYWHTGRTLNPQYRSLLYLCTLSETKYTYHAQPGLPVLSELDQ